MARHRAFEPSTLRSFLKKAKVATLSTLKQALGTTGTMTVFRALKQLGYRSSYSHRGKYYTLDEIAQFDQQGLWTHYDVWFSRFGNLVETAKELVEESTAGFTTEELQQVVHVNPKQALATLYRRQRIQRENVDGIFVYLSKDRVRRRQQLLRRRHRADEAPAEAGEIQRLSEELKAAIILFYSLLDEKQRRLYAGLESQRLGYGGDATIAELLGMDPHTVARGRRELFSEDVHASRIRRPGGGRKPVEKKRPS